MGFSSSFLCATIIFSQWSSYFLLYLPVEEQIQSERENQNSGESGYKKIKI